MKPKCDLCRKDEAVIEQVLCQVCAESIGRLMSVQDWLAALPMDRSRNEEQVRLLMSFEMTSRITPKSWPYKERAANAYQTL